MQVQNPNNVPPDVSGPVAERLEYAVYQELFKRISDEAYSVGERLPTENELAQEFKVSRPVIRTALARLRDDGLVVSRRGAGSFVSRSQPRDHQGFTPLRSIDDISAYWDFRSLIESEACAKAALIAKPNQVEQLWGWHSRIETAIKSQTSTVKLNTEMHTFIAEIAENHFFKDTIRLLTPHMDFVGRFLRSLSDETYQRNKFNMHDEHERIIQAIADKDPEAARSAMIAHINTSQRRIFKGD